MPRTASRARPRPALSGLEHDVMQAIWAAGPCRVETVHQAVSQQRELKEVTIRTVLRRLEAKGYLQHAVDGRAFIYRAIDAPRSLAARAVRQIIDRFCHGSVGELISGLVEDDVLGEADLQALEARIKARRSKPGRKGR
jgi:BlaI family transcriptional regulator, penicillinase repressor